jgi:hypothetical protein
MLQNLWLYKMWSWCCGKFSLVFFLRCLCLVQNNRFKLLCLIPIIILRDLYGYHEVPIITHTNHIASNWITNSIFGNSKLFLDLDSLVIRSLNHFLDFKQLVIGFGQFVLDFQAYKAKKSYIGLWNELETFNQVLGSISYSYIP